MAKKMGYQGRLFYGTAGATATTPVLKRVNCSVTTTVTTGATTSAGDGSRVPRETGSAVLVSKKTTFNVIVDSNDPAVPALIANAELGTPVAIRFVSFSGLTIVDSDVVLEYTVGADLGSEQTIDFSVVVENDDLRDPAV
jgi:hypothetical protein